MRHALTDAIARQLVQLSQATRKQLGSAAGICRGDPLLRADPDRTCVHPVCQACVLIRCNAAVRRLLLSVASAIRCQPAEFSLLTKGSICALTAAAFRLRRS